ncbi:MAG: CHASE domain-containing protein [Pseudomonadota bacterium]
MAAWIALAAACAGAGTAWLAFSAYERALARGRFEAAAGRVENALRERLDRYEAELNSLAAVVPNDGHLPRERFIAYVEQLELERPGLALRTLGYAPWIPGEQRAAHEAALRQEGFPDYRIQPPGEREAYVPVTHLQSLGRQREQERGFDLLTDGQLRGLLLVARDNGRPVATSRLVFDGLRQQIPDGSLSLYYPVFRPGQAVTSLEQRAMALAGFVFGIARAQDLFRDIPGVDSGLALALRETDDAGPGISARNPAPDGAARHYQSRPVNFAERDWLLQISATPAFEADTGVAVWIKAATSAGAGLVLFALLQAVGRSRERETRLALQAAHDAQAREAAFRTIVDAVPNGLIVVDDKGVIRRVNAHAETLFGYTREELMGQPVEMLVPQRLRADHAAYRAAFARSPRARPMGAGRELYGRRKDGAEFPVEIGLTPIQTEDGLLILSSIIDISERKAVERRFREQAEQIAAASRYKSEFLANMSHELRTPLNSILLLSEQLRHNRGGNLTAKQVQHATIIHRSGTDLLTLINDILDLSRIEAGRIPVHISEVSVERVADSVRSSFAPLAENRGLDLTVVVAPDAPRTLLTDGNRLHQILRNLLSNALKFTEHGAIRVRFFRPGQQELPAELGLDAPDAIAIAVTDTGPGIADDKRELIFEAFRQGDGSTARLHGGTGLGLTICRQLATLLGGAVKVTSSLGMGSTFVLYLPVRAPQAQSQQIAVPQELDAVRPDRNTTGGAAQAQEATSRWAGRRVLLVDDDIRNTYALCSLFEDLGLDVVTAGTGREALDVVARDRGIDLVLLDMAMPEMNGYEAARRLKGELGYRGPVVAVTANAMKGDRERCLAAGADDYLAKPVSAADIIALMDRWFVSETKGNGDGDEPRTRSANG